MKSLKNIIQRCHQRHEKSIRQKKTMVTPSTYKGLLYHFTVFCAQKYPVRLHDLEEAKISFMPIGGSPAHDRLPQSFGGDRFSTRQRMKNWETRQWHTSWGIRAYTGIPSERNGARWHDLEFTYQAICAAPEAVVSCIETLVNAVANPLLTLTKSGGLRFSCRTPYYLHPNTEASRLYIYKDVPTHENGYQRDVYLEILGKDGHSPWDARYEILSGDLLEPPVIAKEVLFTSIDALRDELHASAPISAEKPIPTSDTYILSLSSLGSHKLDLAKEAFLKRELVYVKHENEFHYWTQHDDVKSDIDILLWERDGTVWVRASTSILGVPTADTPITSVWDDTGILPPISEIEHPVSEQMLAVREGKLSPLAIKRSDPVLQKAENTDQVYVPLDKNIDKIRSVFKSDVRVKGLIGEVGARSNYEVESHLLKEGPVGFSADFFIVQEAMERFQRRNLLSAARWRNFSFLWDQVKEIPIDVRMAMPFKHGNVCEDPMRFLALAEKGVNASETLCPKCPVYKVCQERGFLSQPATLQRADTQIFGCNRTYLDPQELALSENILEPINHTERLCIIDDASIDSTFLGCGVSRHRLETWAANWQGQVLGNFAQALLNPFDIKGEPDDFIVKRIRTVMQAFQQHEAAIVKQMCQVNIKGKVVERGFIDDDAGAELARWTIAFDGNVSAYIPVNNAAAETLKTKGLPVFQPVSVVPDEETRIPMPIEQAIQLGILDAGTVEKIQAFPSVYRNPDWTFWHQLKRFLAHYTRDADAPMMLSDDVLEFMVPPVIHPNVKRLLLLSATLSERDISKMFPDEEVEVTHIEPAPWIAGNQVFQIRNGIHSLKTMLDYDGTWDVIGLSKLGERFVSDICAEIKRTPNLKHAIITYNPIIEQLRDVAEKENVCLLTEFKDLYELDAGFEAAEVVWIVGTPYWEPGIIWRRAQILYGNDAAPLCYDADSDFQHYKDERIQRIYIQTVTDLITNIIGRAGLNLLGNKKVMLISSLEIPNITDRPETLLFDWEDFQIAGGLDKLAETIAIREKFETERGNLTADSRREKVEQVLGCSTRTANRVLQKFRGGNIPHVTYREQILTLLADGEKKVVEVTEAIDGNSKGIHNELARLAKIGEIMKVRWGVYGLPDSPEK